MQIALIGINLDLFCGPETAANRPKTAIFLKNASFFLAGRRAVKSGTVEFF